ncbi:MAG: TIM barrel protein [Pseudomonadota bacterium]
MPRFSANISTLFQSVPLIERIGLAAECGFDAIEIQFPYSESAAALRAELDRWQLPLVLINVPVGDLMEGGEGLAAVPGCEARFDDALREAREYVEVLQPRALNVLAGRPKDLHARSQCEAVFRRNLRKAFSVVQAERVQLVTEPVNTVDMPGFFLSRSQQAVELIDSLPELVLAIQYDLYHVAVMEGDVMTSLTTLIDKVGHIQFSDVPGRTEPRGGLDFAAIFELVDSLDYSGYVGAEYFPTQDTADTLGWLEPYKQPARGHVTE